MLNVKSGQLLLPNQTYAHTNIGVAPSSESNATLSTWIKIGAKLWSQGKLSNDIFGDSIQYLIKVGAIEKPNPSQTPLHQSMYIPRWFKNNAGWWADGQISNSDFISAVQYLLDSRIIQMSS